jgi:nucleotide-binding universal stress UspA family protein
MTILVGLDGSTPSHNALLWALARAQQSGDTVRLVHVIDDEWGQVGAGFAEEATEAGARLISDAVREAQSNAHGITIEERVVHGSPAWELAAQAGADDLIVVGTHKTGYLHGRALGSRSIVVASVAPCSVMVIPDSSPSPRHGVVVGVASESWHAAVAFGADEAVRSGAELSLVHAVPDEVGSHDDRALLAEAAKFAIDRPGGDRLEVRSRVSRREPAVALLDAARSASMLVVSPTRGPVDRAGFVGSVTHAVLLNITSPVVVARGGE